MKSKTLAALTVFLHVGCGTTPQEEADIVRMQPGSKPLRVGLVTLSEGGRLRRALAGGAEPAAVPAAAVAAANGPAEVYSKQVVLPQSIAAEDVRKALVDLKAFSDVVDLSFDPTGIATREDLFLRLQDELWDRARAEQLDAILVVDGVRDRGLQFSDADESIFSLDTVLWWLTWPFGVLIPDRSYTADVALAAALLSVHDKTAKPAEALAGARAHDLKPWTRASTPVLGFLLPPAWIGDDHQAVSDEVREWSRATLPIELARRIKEMPLASAPDVLLSLTRNGDQADLVVDSLQEITEASLVSLPRGLLAGPAAPVPVPLKFTIKTTEQRELRHVATGSVAAAAVERPDNPLMRVWVKLASGEQVSMTYPWTPALRR